MAQFTPTRGASTVPARAQEKGVFADASFFTSASTAQDDYGIFVHVPVGATVLDVHLQYAASMGTSTTLSVGDADNATYYINAQSTSSGTAGRARTTAVPKKYASGGDIKVTVGGGNLADSKVFGVIVYMTMEDTDLS